MNPKRKYGRAEIEPIILLPAVTFDMSEGKPLDPNMSKADVPMTLLPPVEFDLLPVEPVPALQLSLSLRPGAAPEEVTHDLLRLYEALNQLDLSEPGGGLTPDEALCGVTPIDRKIRITLKANDPDGAEERLARLARLIDEAASRGPSERPQYPSIERYEAKVVPNAA